MQWRRILYDWGPWFSWVRAVYFRNQVSLMYIYIYIYRLHLQRTPHIWGLLAGLASKKQNRNKEKEKQGKKVNLIGY